MKSGWTPEQEASRLAERFVGVNQAAFARTHGVPGGASMLSQHIKGRRPITMEAALAYARGFGVQLEEISPRLAAQAHEAAQIQRAIAAGSDALAAHIDELNVGPAPAAVVTYLADLLDAMDDVEREHVAQRMLTLARAPDSQRARDALITALATDRTHQKPLGAPIAPAHRAELERLSEEAEGQHGHTGQQRRRTAKR